MNNTSLIKKPNASRGFAHLSHTEAWLCASGIEALTIIALNVLTLIVLTQTYGLRKRTTYFLINLAVTDLFVGLLPLPMYMVFIADPDFFHNKAILLEAFKFLDMMFGACSIWTLALISLERLCIVLVPYVHRSAKLCSYYCAIGFCWLLPGIVCVIGFLPRYGLLTRTTYLYITFLSLLFIPTATLVISHIALAIKFDRRSSKIPRRARQENDLSKTLFIVTGTFLLTCLPFQTLVFVIALDPINYPPIIVIVLLKLLQYGNSFMNPVIYWPRLPGFKDAARKLLSSKSRRLTRQYFPTSSSAV